MRNHSLGILFAMVLSFSSTTIGRTKPPAKATPKAAAIGSKPVDLHDLSGVWMLDSPRPDTVVERFWVYELNAEEPPMTAWGQAQYNATKSSFGKRSYPLAETNDPIFHTCTPPGFPRIFLHPFPMQIVQTRGEVLVLFEWDSMRHAIYIDGRAHDTTLGPLWMGDAIGHWEGDTLVADTTNFNTKTWLDRIGHPHSDALHVVERIRRINHEHLIDDITIDDPKAYEKLWTAHLDFLLRPKWTLAEQFCEDQESFQSIENEEVTPAK